MSSKDRILGRVRAALVDVPEEEAPDDVPVPRDYDRDRDLGDLGAVFAERLRDYRALVRRVTPAQVPGEVAAALRRRDARRVAAPADLPAEWLPRDDRVEVVRDDPPLGVTDLDGLDGTITGCTVAIAETGTIVLDGGAAQGRRVLTLIPDYHLCVVSGDRLVGTVPEAIVRIAPDRALTWISGPSATSDIELDRVEGVHGPRTLEILVVS